MITLSKPITKQKAKETISRMLWSYGTGSKEDRKKEAKHRALLIAVISNRRAR